MTRINFDGLVTIDKKLKYQQNLDKYNVQLINLNFPGNKLSTLKPYVQALEDHISNPTSKIVLEIIL